MKKSDQHVVELAPLQVQRMEIAIEGVTELIVHRWSDKAKQMMLDKELGKATRKKPPRNPQEEYEACLYRLDDGRYGFPATGFKAAIVGACRLFDGLTMTAIKSAVFVDGIQNSHGEVLVPIIGEPHMREDMVRLGQGQADLRYRAGFWPWRAVLPITFVSSAITPEQVVALVDAAGLGGVGEWRPSAPKSATGSFGRFRVAG